MLYVCKPKKNCTCDYGSYNGYNHNGVVDLALIRIPIQQQKEPLSHIGVIKGTSNTYLFHEIYNVI